MLVMLIAEVWSKEKFKYKGKTFQYYCTMHIPGYEQFYGKQ